MKAKLFILSFLSMLALQSKFALAQDASSAMMAKLMADLPVATKAYLYGYPLAIMDRLMREAYTVKEPTKMGRAPVNTFGHVRQLVTPETSLIVRPNNDTLYSSAFLDLRARPLILHVPDTHNRYYSLQFMDAYTNVFTYVGRRSTGTKEGWYVITGPGFAGTLPAGMTEIKAPTHWVWILGRTLVDGSQDLAAVNALQDELTLTPYGGDSGENVQLPPLPPTSDTTIQTFAAIGEALMINPPPAADKDLVEQFKAIGLDPQTGFDADAVTAERQAELAAAIAQGEKLLDRPIKDIGDKDHGLWHTSSMIGNYGQNYLLRAFIAKYGLAANIPQEAVYLTTNQDSSGELLIGGRSYVLHFPADRLPPVDAFWSITLYGPDGYFVPNSISRYAIGDRTRPLNFASDGSLDILLQAQSPQSPTANWLPTPATGEFSLVLRAYQPHESILNGSYQVPAVLFNR